MIFGFLVKALRFLVDGFASVCAFLLVTLGLWLPAVYSLLFLIVCAISGIKLQGTVITLYIVGLVLAFSGSVAISVLRARGRRKAKRGTSRVARTNVRSVRRSDYSEYSERSDKSPERYDGDNVSDFSAEQASDYASDPVTRSEPAPEPAPEPPRESLQPQNTVGYAKSELYGDKKDYKYDDFADLRKKYFGDENASDEKPAPQRDTKDDSYGGILSQSGFVRERERYGDISYPVPDALSREQLERRLMGTKTEEQPMIFATRRDPDIIVYEYSDRLKFFRKTKRGLIHISTEFKK